MDSFELMVQQIRTIGLPALLSFHTVARLGGVTAAARQLGMAKSGVSRHLARLENHLGVRLLERGGRSVRLTPIGETLNERIRSILAEIDMLEDIAREESAGVSGHVTIATTPEFGGVVASVLYPAARERHPNLTFVIRPAYEFEDMGDPGTDLAFRIGSFADDRLVAINLGKVRIALVAAPDIARKHPVKRPGDLAAAPCLAFQGTRPETVWTFVKDGERTQVEIRGRIAVKSFASLLDLAVAGHGYAFLPAFLVTDALRRGALVSCLPDHESRPYPVYLTFRPGARRIARVGATIALAEALLPDVLSG